ncbi:MAG: hypothetical protein KGN01_06530 [Patescibacteria group bacterium]|nr:hypothetical protein [Patescibacteria group bacterium]
MRELEKRGHTIYNVSENQKIKLSDFDVLRLARGYEGNYLEIIMAAKSNGLKIVYDTDDAIDLVPRTNIFYDQCVKGYPSYYTLLRMCDAVTCTTQELADHLKKLTDAPITVLPNCLDFTEFKMGNPPLNDIKRIGFAGSNTHIVDILPALDALIELQNDYDFEFYLFGFSETDEWKEWVWRNYGALNSYPNHPFRIALEHFEKKIKKIEKQRIKWIPAVKIDSYFESLSNLKLDIGLCPLIDDPFNRCKSPIKAMEYSICGTLPIYSSIPPFHGISDTFIDNDKESWVTSIGEALMMKNDDIHEKVTYHQDYFSSHYSSSSFVESWEKVFSTS